MLGPATLLAVLMTAYLSIKSTEGAMRRVCYYTNWAQYRPGSGKFTPPNVDPTLCTHFIYAFAKLVGNDLTAFEWNDESTPWSTGMYEQFNNLKQRNPAMKTLLALGGWNLGSAPFTAMVATQQTRAEFIQSAVAFLRKHNFDGLDLDWEYPANRGSPAGDRDKYTALLRELRTGFEQEAARTGNSRLLVTAAVAAGKDKIDTAYDIPEINKYLDFFNLMTYDLHGSWESFTGHHTALFPRAAETGDQRYLNVEFAAKYWVQKGASPDKLVIGVASYGRSFTLASPSQNGLGAPARSGGTAGTATREAGFLAYYEICQMMQQGGQVHEDPEQHVRYLTLGNQWVGFEDQTSLTEKVCYIKQQGYGGVMMWALDEDDFSGNVCGQGPYPLLHAINNELNNPSFNNCPNPAAPIPVRTTQPPLPVTPGPPSTYPSYSASQDVHTSKTIFVGPGNPNDFSCMNLPSDFYPNPKACEEYIICANQMSYRVRCATGLYYNPVNKHCDWPANVHCVNVHPGSSQQTATPAATFPVVTFPPFTTPQYIPPVTTHPPTTTTPQPPTTAVAAGTMVSVSAFCASQPDGRYRDPSNCNNYIECLLHLGFVNHCATGMVFNQAMDSCQHPYNTPECATYH